jgi:hypothetical protein
MHPLNACIEVGSTVTFDDVCGTIVILNGKSSKNTILDYLHNRYLKKTDKLNDDLNYVIESFTVIIF